MDQIQWPGWEVTRLIGTGSFGAVYEIERNLYGNVEKAALKVIHIPQSRSDIEELYNDGFDDESITARFNGYLEDIIREYSLMASLKGNKNVVYCDDVRQIQHEDGIGWDIYIKMELLTPLVKTLGKTVSEDEVINIGIDMCNALVLCKEQNIVHRDIKPQNIFVSKDGVYKLGDFGIAKTAERTTSGTKTGTYKYMAPEVYKSQPYGAAADQYSLGMVLYWLLNERRTPFLPLPSAVKATTVTMEDAARKRRFDGEQIPPPAHGSKQLQSIVLKACAYDPKDRFANAAEMLEALKALKNVDASPAAAVPMGAAAVIAGGAAAGAAADEMTTGTVGRQKGYVPEEGTVGVFGAGAVQPAEDATAGVFHNGNSANQQIQRQTRQVSSQQGSENYGVQGPGQNGAMNATSVVTTSHDQKEEKKKKRGIAAWIAIAAGLIVVIGGVLLLTLGKGKDSGDQSDMKAAVNSQPQTEPGETLPVQLDWAEWADELPAYVTDDNYSIEERTLYRSRNLETTSSTTSDKMDGWELYDTATGNGDYGAWSDWSATAVSASDTRDVETQIRYRYSDKETTTGSSSSKTGWTLEDTTYSWGDYGAWSDWSATAVSKSDSRQVETQTRYRYRDKETTTSTSGSMSGWTQYNSTTSWGAWGSWSGWATDYVSANDGRQVETKKQYRYRDIYYTTQYTSWGSWSSWQDSYVAHNDLTDVETRTAYHYYYFVCGNCGAHMHGSGQCYTWAGGCGSSNVPSSSYTAVRCTVPYSSAGNFHGTGVYYTDNTGSGRGFAYIYSSSPYYVAPITQYRYRTRSTYQDKSYGSWSSWSDSSYSSSSTREVETRTMYRYRTRSQVSTYYYYRWKDWSSWSTTAVSGNDNRQVETAAYYRYRDRASVPTYHFSRWKDWSSWSETSYSQSSTRKVETATFYRYRDRVTQTTYYFQRWTEWSDYTESPVDESDTVEVETKTQYRYKSKET